MKIKKRLVQISDNGGGVHELIISKVFEPFYNKTANPTRNRTLYNMSHSNSSRTYEGKYL